MSKIDFGQVANSYARSREDIPVALMESLQLRNIFFEGKRIADIGSGTGVLARKMAMRKANVIGIEPSQELLKKAIEFNQMKNFDIPFQQGTAEDTGLEDSQFDIVTVMRAWHWFDRMKAIQEIKRILKAKGTLLVIDSGFLTGPTVVEKTLEVIGKFVEGELTPAGSKADSKMRINGFPVEWFEEWKKEGFEIRDFYKLNYSVSFSKEEWVERIGSVSWLAGLKEPIRKKALKELTDSLPAGETYEIPHDCGICILRLV